jgi:hypothetical protein
LLLGGCPEHLALLIEVIPPLNLENYAIICVLLLVYSPKIAFNIFKDSVAFVSSLKKNLMQICCSFKSATL